MLIPQRRWLPRQQLVVSQSEGSGLKSASLRWPARRGLGGKGGSARRSAPGAAGPPLSGRVPPAPGLLSRPAPPPGESSPSSPTRAHLWRHGGSTRVVQGKPLISKSYFMASVKTFWKEENMIMRTCLGRRTQIP